MSEPEKIALIDLDGTLADYEHAMRERLFAMMSGPEELRGDKQFLKEGNIFDSGLPWLEARMDAIKKQPSFWSTLPRIPTGFRVFGLLGDLGYRRMVLTKGPRRTVSAWSEKLEWCNKNLPNDTDVTITMDKGLVYGKVLFDDYPPYVERWLQWRPRGKVLMLDSPHNKDFEHPQVLRVQRRDFSASEAQIYSVTLVKEREKIQEFLEST